MPRSTGPSGSIAPRAQLPPISRGVIEPPYGTTPADAFLNFGYAFQSPAWRRLRMRSVLLTRVYRQRDGELVELLGAVRSGEPAALRAALRRLCALCGRPLAEGAAAAAGVVPTRIFARNRDVDDVNLRELGLAAKRAGGLHSLRSLDSVAPLPTLADALARDEEEGQAELVRLMGAADVGGRLPASSARLDAWLESDAALCMPASPASPAPPATPASPKGARPSGGGGGGGVGVGDPETRRKLLDGEFFRDCMAPDELRLCVGAQVMLLKNLDTAAGLVNGSRGVVVAMVPAQGQAQQHAQGAAGDPAALAWSGRAGNRMLPVVRFVNGTTMTVQPASFSASVDAAGCAYECTRMQVPLKLAWAITVHKSQGMTLDYACVSLKSMFASGQVYVALSRARSVEGLQLDDLDGLDLRAVRPDPAVLGFYARMAAQDATEDAEDAGKENVDPAWARWQAQRKAAARGK